MQFCSSWNILWHCLSWGCVCVCVCVCACLCAPTKSPQSCPTLCNPMDYSHPVSSVHGDSPGRNTRVDCHAFLQGIFPTQELSPRLLHLQADSLPLAPPWKPHIFYIPVYQYICTNIYIFFFIFYYGLFQDIEYNFLCYTVRPYYLFYLFIQNFLLYWNMVD